MSSVLRLVLCVLYVLPLCPVSVKGSVFSRNYHGIKEAFEEDIPQGASTLAFVFDITGSMYDDLVQVIEGAARILSTVLARREKAIHNYVLVPFHDPDVGPVTATTDPDLFQRQLKELYVQGGGDCPEMSIGAIKLALEVSHPSSHIYVFTDARSKDYYLLDDVLKLIQRKQSQVVFVMTGDCGNHSHPGYQAYEKIASTSSGQVFHLLKSDVDEVLNFVRVSLQARKVNLFAVDRSAGDLKEFEFDVDGSLREFTISVSGENPAITVINSRGEVIDQNKGLFELLNHKNISIVNIKDPLPGRWRLRVNSEGAHTIRATGLSKIDFVHGFSRQPTANLKETYHRPLKGAPTYLLVNATDLPEPATFRSVKVVDLEGNSLQNIPLQRFPGSNLFNATRFVPPNDFFYLKVAGSDEHGYPIERMTSTAISSQLPDAPEVSTRPYMTGFYEEDTDIRCYVQSLVPFSVTWYKGGVQISQSQRFPQTSEVILTVPEVTLLSEGFYSCNASNVAGQSSSVIFLDVKEPPPLITSSGNVSGIIGSTAVLPCEVESIVDNYQIAWNKLAPDSDNFGFVKPEKIPDDPRFVQHSNNSLVVRSLRPQDQGWYRCSASNEGGVVQENIFLHTYYPPTINVTPQKQNFVAGNFINITCQAAGYPDPSVRWIWSPVHNNNFASGRSKVLGKSLIIESTIPEDEGRYDCIATNVAGSQGASAFLTYIEAPLISVPEEEMTVKNGEQALLRCIAEGIPDPSVRWFKGPTEIQPLSYMQITSDGSLLIYDVQETDSGNYTCTAQNEAGITNATINLNVGSKPSLIKLPSVTSVEVLHDVAIPCIATGIPKPDISWLFENGTVINSDSKYNVDSDGSLRISNAGLDVVGNYTCRAENKFGREELKVHLALTGIKKPVLSPLPPTTEIPKGETRVISCLVLDSNPPPRLFWLKNGKPILPGYGLQVMGDKLEIVRADESHEANYTCIASNIGGSVSEETYVNVLYQPEIYNGDKEFETVEGSHISIPCEVKGDPRPAIIWFKDGIELSSYDDYAVDRNGNLKIKLVKETHDGEYICSASNIIGTSDQVFKLSVKVPPKIHHTASTYNATEGEMVILPCTSYAKPPAQIHWTRLNHPDSSSLGNSVMYNGSLMLKALFEDSGLYVCEAKNEVGTAKFQVQLNVFVPPHALMKASNPIISSVGIELSILCETSGYPKPEVIWERNNVQVTPSNRISISEGHLVIHHIEQFDEGEYVCIAKNHVGSFADRRLLTVHDVPKILRNSSSPEFMTAVVGDKLDIVCHASGYPSPRFTWDEPKKNMVHHIKENILHIPFVQESDSGIYICTAQNVAGFDSRTFNISVYVPPVSVSQTDHDIELVSGNEAVFDCAVSALPPPEVHWFKNGQIVTSSSSVQISENGQKLAVKNISASNNGEYICIAKNVVGETTNRFKLTVSDPPQFRKGHNQDMSVMKNKAIILDCSAKGYPEPVFIWRKNGQVLSGIKHGMKFKNSKSILEIEHLQELDSGKYSCIAMNKVGSISRDFEVSVLVPPQIQEDEFEDLEVLLHQSTDLKCIVDGNPFPSIKWFKDDNEVKADGIEISLSNDHQTLSILKPEPEDSGSYTCIASNEIGEERKVVNLDVLEPPHIDQQSLTESYRLKEGESLKLHCDARGNPVPKILWLRNGHPVPLKLYYANENILDLQNVARKDAGRYVCIASNKAGSHEKDFNIVVLSPPKPEASQRFSKYSAQRRAKTEAMENSPFVLICPFSGYPVLQFTWMKDGQTVNPAINPSFAYAEGGKHLEVKQAKANHSGKYTCIAKNEAGESRQDFLVDILVPPSISSDPVTQKVVEENGSLILNCTPNGNPLPSVVWLLDDTEIEPTEDIQITDQNTQLIIPNVEARHSGTYVCIATNVAGSVEKEFNVDVLFSPRFSQQEPEELRARPTAYVNKPITIECPLSGNPLPQINWLKNGQPINLDEEKNIYIHNEGQKLSLMRAKNEDTGLYSCIAENDVGSQTYDFNLEILAPPVINKKNLTTSYYVKEGDSVKIICPISGHPFPIITWLKDSNVMSPLSSPHIDFSEDFQSIELRFASLRDAGKYSCIAGNEVGTAEQDFKVDVQVPPKLENLEDIPANKSAILNKPVTISCPVSGVPPPLVKWYKDGKPLNSNSNPNIMLSANSRHLKIFRTQVTDAGVYTCKASNDVGKIEKEFNLDVQVPPSMMETNSVLDYFSEDDNEVKNELKAIENGTSQIECFVYGNPMPVVLWIKDGHLLNLSSEHRYELEEDGQVLLLHGIKSSDAGHYTCVASNVAGTKERSFLLDVHVPPQVKGPKYATQEVLPNRPTTLECSIESNPPASITWFKDGKPLDFSKHKLMKPLEDGRVLQLMKATREDDGLYTCEAINDIGKVERHFKVDVFAPPEIQDTTFDSDVLENEKVTLMCNAVGNPKPNIVWLKDNQLINSDYMKNVSIKFNSDASLLQIDVAKQLHSGQYKCIVSNTAGSVEKSFDLYVKVPSRIVNTSEPNKTVFLHQPVSMFCVVEAEPESTIVWTKDGHPLNDAIDPFIHILDDGQKLQILRTRATDDGHYYCEVSNSVGNDSRSFILNVLVPPKIKGLQDNSAAQILKGNNASLECYVYGNPQPIVSWYKGEKPLHSGERVHFLDNYQVLQLTQVNPHDKGNYRCVTSSLLGYDERRFEMDVLVPPKILDGPSDNIAHLEKELNISCNVDGNPKPIITWMKNGQLIDLYQDPNIQFLKEKSVLHIRWTRTEDAGKYTCIASSSYGQDEKTFNVHVHVPANIDQSNIKDEVLSMLHQSTTLMCPATGVPLPSITWSKENETLKSGGKYQILEDGMVFKIITSEEEDAGKYKCISSNDAGKDEMEFNVDVMVPPQMKSNMDESEYFEQTSKEGENIIIGCPIDDSEYPATVTWKKNGKSFNPNAAPAHIEFSQDHKQIKMMKAQATDSGIYSCTASNPAGDMEHEIDLLVIAPSVITHPSENLTSTYVKEHHSIALSCSISGHPQPSLKWYRNGSLLLEQYNTSFSGYGKLKITDASAKDAGLYSCQAENEGGIDRKFYDLTVFIPPLINVSSHGVHKVALQNTDLNLECPTTGIPKPRVVWFKGSQMLLPGSRISFSNDGESVKISHALPSDAGKYTCLAVNEAGDTEAEHLVKVHVPPIIEKVAIQGSQDPVVNQSVRMGCDVHGLPFPKVTWLLNGISLDQNSRFISSGGGQYLDVLNLQSSDSGRFTCRAENIAGTHEKDIDLLVSVPPDVDENVQSKEQQVILGKSTRMDCEASGTPPPSITWLKNGLPLTNEDHVQLLNNDYSLLILYASEKESGVYSCIATNNVGSVEQKFNLTVLVPPMFGESSKPENLSFHLGFSGHLRCAAQGYPPPDIAWYKEGEVVSNDESVSVREDILEFSNIDLSHNGTYICEASSVAGKMTKLFEVFVNVPPKMDDIGNKFTTAVSGSTTTMQCSVSGIPFPSVMWFKNEVLINLAYSPRFQTHNRGTELSIHNTTFKDSGSYRCVATNPAGDSSRSFILNVLVPPTIRKSPSFVKSQVGSEALLQCDTDGSPPPEISWIKNGSPITSTNFQSNIIEKTSLLVSDVKLQDSGTYTCIAINEAGQDSKDFELLVNAPPSIKDSIYFQKVLSGDPAFLPCNASGHPPPIIMWHKDSVMIQNSKDIQVLSDGTLHFLRTNTSLSGLYKCFAENEAGSQEAERNLMVLSLPQISPNIPEKYEVIQAQPVVLQCSADGSPSPSIAWEHNGASIDLYNPRYKVFPSGDLHISLTQSSDMGTYTCIAKNEAGSATQNIDLIVLVPPTVMMTNPAVNVLIKGRNLVLSCSATGFPPPHINWQKGGIPITGATNGKSAGKLYIENIQSEDSGTYVCVAANSVGRDHESVVVEVHVPPTITSLPKSQDISVGDILSLTCEATGYPIPSVTWLLNNTQVTGSAHSVLGRSKLQVENAGKEDEGTYICLAQNAAGERKAAAAVRIRTPPVIIHSSGIMSVKNKDTVVLDCSVSGDPLPNIIWLKNGQQVELNQRIQMSKNGSLFIYDSSDQDSGQYKCVASNDFGLAEQVAELIIRSKPTFVIEPHDTKANEGSNIHLDCKVIGEPKPTALWLKDSLPLQKSERVLILPNNTLKVVAIQLSDEGLYSCVTNNTLGSAVSEAEVIVQVNGKWSNWQEWEPCSSSCGDGQQIRQRFCNDPPPRNGGKTCIGISKEVRHCKGAPCPVMGEWGNWMEWSHCSTSCGEGQKRRVRKCDNPAPQFGGAPCIGENNQTESCLVAKCRVDGNWGTWSDWESCSVTCGKGIQERTRECNNPEPLYGGNFCEGDSKDFQEYTLRDCPVHGEWSDWQKWSLCSSSCGGGTRERKRLCDSPVPAFGGYSCLGSNVQVDYCNNVECPVNGEWSQWSSWGPCSASCNKGQKKRFRACENPAPAGGGRDCVGSSQEIEVCNAQPCPANGEWDEWSIWSPCSTTCGIGVRSRNRICLSADIILGSKDCPGESEDVEECGDEACDVAPTQAIGHLIGVINGVEFGSKMFSNMSQFGMQQTVTTDIENVTEEVAGLLRLLVPLLTPIYWTAAYEVGDAGNGYSLTKGFFRKESQVNFATGEVIQMTHVARGLDRNGNLLVDIVVSGTVPEIITYAVVLHPYIEDYLQTGPRTIYALSTRTYEIGGYVLPYYWNHSITYDESFGEMPYLTQRLFASDMDSYYDPNTQQLNFIVSASITKGSDDKCLQGFRLSLNELYCLDINECILHNPCSHICINFPGGFSCQCLPGYVLGVDGESCTDVDECENDVSTCSSSEECVNTLGSYKCLIKCRAGYRRSDDDLYCLDVDECSENLNTCNQLCINAIGSYSCGCNVGYYLSSETICSDIDECHSIKPPCSHLCINSPGGYYCSCPEGYELIKNMTCTDIDECDLGAYICPEGEDCKNADGGYECINSCSTGLIRSEDGLCIDIDECATGLSTCHSSQICINTHGNYHCSCPRGYYSKGAGLPCQDINECLQRPKPCSYLCQNIPGDYECICSPGFKRLPDRKTCAGIEYLNKVDSDHLRNQSHESHSNNQVQAYTQAVLLCPAGLRVMNGTCQDINECEDKNKCQHLCENTIGSYRCVCPAGYRIAGSGKLCQDINECLESNINCGPDRMCFNMRGSYECIETPCPPNYDRDSETGFCKLSCEKAGISCPPNAKYAEILAFKMVALPSGIQAYQDLIRLVAYDQDGKQVPNTVFSIIENKTGIPFRIRLEEGKGVLYTQNRLESNQEYKIKVQSLSYDEHYNIIQFKTKFLVFLSVSQYPY